MRLWPCSTAPRGRCCSGELRCAFSPGGRSRPQPLQDGTGALTGVDQLWHKAVAEAVKVDLCARQEEARAGCQGAAHQLQLPHCAAQRRWQWQPESRKLISQHARCA